MRHVKINGIWYRLAEDAEGQHYARNREPLRPPNAQLVQGDSTDFQLRPDSLLWRWTDWSGGEGQLKWTTADANRAYLLQNIDPFTRPGSIQLGYAVSAALSSDGVTPLTGGGLGVVLARGKVWAFRSNVGGVGDLYEWDPDLEKFKTPVTVASLLFTTPYAVIGDNNYLYLWDRVNNRVRSWDETTNLLLNDQTGSLHANLTEQGAYLYLLFPLLGKLYEISKTVANTTTPEPTLYEFSPSERTERAQAIVPGDGKIYFFTREGMNSTIHEVVPSNAAGAGYGRILTTLRGLRAEALWFSGGTLFVMGTDDFVLPSTPVGPDRQVFYIDPQGSYGTLGSLRGFVRSPVDHGIANPLPSDPAGTYPFGAGHTSVSGKLGRIAIGLEPTWEEGGIDDVELGLFEIDTITGGMAAVGVGSTMSPERPSARTPLVFHRGKFFEEMFFNAAGYNRIAVWDTQAFNTGVPGYAISAVHDFNLASNKILETIEVSCEPLPASTVIAIGYSLDGAAWVDTNVVTTTGATSGSLQVSTDSSTKTFNNLQIRVKLTGSGGNSPVVRSIDTFARVNRKINTWDLLLDISDDSAPQGYSGQQILDNLLTISDNTVIDFVDRYGTHIHDSGGDQYDVVIDAMSAVLDQPGEGVVAIRIVETI